MPSDPQPNKPEIEIPLVSSSISTASVEIRRQVAAHPETETGILDNALSGDADDEVRREVARNPNTPERALVKLSQDKRSSVVMAVAANPSTPTVPAEIKVTAVDPVIWTTPMPPPSAAVAMATIESRVAVSIKSASAGVIATA